MNVRLAVSGSGDSTYNLLFFPQVRTCKGDLNHLIYRSKLPVSVNIQARPSRPHVVTSQSRNIDVAESSDVAQLLISSSSVNLLLM